MVISPQPMQLGLYRLQEQLEGIITEEARGKIMEEGMRTGRLLIFIIQLKAQATRLSRSRPLRERRHSVRPRTQDAEYEDEWLSRLV